MARSFQSWPCFRRKTESLLVAPLVLCIISMIIGNDRLLGMQKTETPQQVNDAPDNIHLKGAIREVTTDSKNIKPSQAKEKRKENTPPRPYAGFLDCSSHGGPANEFASEMVYWSDIPSDRAFVSPFYSNSTKKYMTFEPDFAGWNNVRMAFETMVLLAHSTGRTLVLPPSQKMYWLHKPFSFEDVYDFEKIRSGYAGFDIITMEQFLQEEALAGNLKLTDTGTVAYPIDNRTNWNSQPKLDKLKQYLQSVAFTPGSWQPRQCIVAFPNHTYPGYFNHMKYLLRNVTNNFAGPYPNTREYLHNRVQVNATPLERIREAITGGTGGSIKRLCLYDASIQERKVIHFPCNRQMRILTHHYHFLFYLSWRHDLWTKRFVRDNLRYHDSIQCAAARIVNAIRQRAQSRDINNPGGEYDSFHIRRGDLILQYKNTNVSSEEIYQNSFHELRANGTIFIATDHADHDFFAPFVSRYDVTFLDDFQEELMGVDKMYYGMIDQLVASRGRVFFGSYQSTFSNLIFRIRAWQSQRDKPKGYENGTLDNSFYYIMPNKTYTYRKYAAISSPAYMREWPVAWKDMDRGIGENINGDE